MEEIILEVKKRQELGSGNVGRLRKRGLVPAIVYGEGKESLPIEIAAKDLVNLLAAHRGESFVLKLRIKDDKSLKDKSVLIKQIQYHPVRDDVIHVDFNEISLTKTIKVKIPIVAKGDAVGVKLEGGVLDHILWEIEIECLPTKIPKAIEVDVTNLKMGDSVHVKNLSIPEGVKLLQDPEAIVLAVVHPKEEAIPTPGTEEVTGEAVKAEPEVIKEKKEKPEAQEAQEGKGPAGQEKK